MPTFTSQDEAIQYMKGQLESYLTGKGIPTNKMFCCLNPDHADKHPSMKFKASPTQSVVCFSQCANEAGMKGKPYDIFDVIGFDYGLTDAKEKFKKALEIFDVQVQQEKSKARPQQKAPATHQAKTPKPITEGVKQAMTAEELAKRQETAQKVQQVMEYTTQHLAETDYLQRRGISKETISPFSIGYNPQTKTVVFQNTPYSITERVTDDNAAHSYRYKNTGHVEPWNIKALAGNRPVFVTEGIIDALSIVEVGGCAVALNSANGTTKFIELIRKAHKRIPPIVCLLDKDHAGDTATKQLLDGLKPYQSVETIDGRGLLPAGMDANKYLLSDKAEFTKRIHTTEQQALKPIQDYRRKHSAAGYMAEYRRNVGEYEVVAKTGFPRLDKALGGGLGIGLCSVGGLSGIGKTTFTMQVADNLAASGQDVIIFSLEMSKFDLISKSISRLTFLSDFDNARSTMDIMQGKRYSRYSEAERQTIEAAFDTYESRISDHLFIHESNGDITVLPTKDNEGKSIREIVEEHIKTTGNKPVVFVDYLQIIAPMDVRATDKQAVDRNVHHLRQLARDYGLSIVVISSFNRESYDSPISMASFKESGSIEYSSDLLLGLQYYGMNHEEDEGESGRKKRVRQLIKKINEQRKRGEAIPVQLRILKNRLAPPTDEVCFDFFSRYNCFNEIMGEPVTVSEIPEDIQEQAEQQALQGL
jgi:replicative DNA helicase